MLKELHCQYFNLRPADPETDTLTITQPHTMDHNTLQLHNSNYLLSNRIINYYISTFINTKQNPTWYSLSYGFDIIKSRGRGPTFVIEQRIEQRDCGLEGHSYADDTQAYLSVSATDAA